MRLKTCFAAALVWALAGTAFAEQRKPGEIHDYPWTDATKPFKPHQLNFETPKDGTARAEFRSEPFYAIILKSGPRCSFTEAERLEIQRSFPRNQVFFERYDCPEDLEDIFTYSNVNTDVSFMAVFGGLTQEEAEALMTAKDLRAAYPGANIRRMQAILAFP